MIRSFLTLAAAAAATLWAEQLTISTTYPSPVGVYNYIITTGNGGLNTILARNGGKVGIGTATPVSQLHVHAPAALAGGGADQVVVEGPGNGGGYVRLQGDFPTLRFATNGGPPGMRNYQIQNSGGQLVFGSAYDDWSWNASNTLVLTAGGQVGIRTNSVQANSFVEIADNPTGYSLVAPRIWSSLYVNAASYLISGACYAGSCASDARVKERVRPFTPGLEALLAIKPIYYRYNGRGGLPKSDHDLLGVAAEDVEKGAPELISGKKVRLRPGDAADTEIKQVDYTGLRYMLINAVKELHARTAKLESENRDLRARVERLSAAAKQKTRQEVSP